MRTIARGRDPEVAKLVRHLAARRIAAEGNSRIRAARVVVGGGAGVDGVGHAATDGAEEERLARRDAHTLRRDELRRCKPPGPRCQPARRPQPAPCTRARRRACKRTTVLAPLPTVDAPFAGRTSLPRPPAAA